MPDTFKEYRELILQGLKENRDDHLRIHQKLDKINNDLTIVKVKASMYGAAAGVIPAILLGLLAYLTK